ncbi:hypothetical protein PG993_001797 [Apiospora rasikravindrae]|uniref:Uncharacterized protein n=1 Tax=Apiospora rasikravindrae TaxID=990691 RepID=A0ABR1UET5_9PEZI
MPKSLAGLVNFRLRLGYFRVNFSDIIVGNCFFRRRGVAMLFARRMPMWQRLFPVLKRAYFGDCLDLREGFELLGRILLCSLDYFFLSRLPCGLPRGIHLRITEVMTGRQGKMFSDMVRAVEACRVVTVNGIVS